MNPSDSDLRVPPLPSPNGVHEAYLVEETGAYTPIAGSEIAESETGSRQAGDQRFDFLDSRFDFLDSLRDKGEFGWLSHYRVQRLLGQGAMGLVFLAEDSLLFRPVALKVMRPEIADAHGIAQRFMREARATAAIKHDHIVTIYQVGDHNGLPFLAMEYLTGISLAQWLERGHSPSVELVLRLGREIAMGLSAAHRHGLIHRDIKPANIWLEAPSGRVKILDFGMARSQREDVEITHSGAVMGTPAYMSPEQARGDSVGAGSDLFSLGCVMYRLCTGRLPFEGESVMAVLSALSTDDPRRPAEWHPELPQTLDDLIMGLLAKEPENRPESAEVVVKEIRTIERELRALQQEAERSAATALLPVSSERQVHAPTDEEPSPSKSPVKSHARRHRIGIAAAVLAMLAVAAVVDFVFVARRKLTTRIVAVEQTSVPAVDEWAARSITTTSNQSERQAQPEGSPDQRGPRSDRGIVPQTNSVTRPAAGESIVANNPGLPPADQSGMVGTPQPETPPPTSRSIADDPPHEEKTGLGLPVVHVPGEKETLPGQAQAIPARKSWTDIVDPDGDCKVELDERENRLMMIVPGKTHLLSAEIGRMNAPRVLRDINGDFDVNVRVSGTNHPGGKATTTLYPPYHGAGILLWQDSRNYVRLEIATDLNHGKARPYVNFEYRRDGALEFSRGIPNNDGSSQLRLKRRGDEILASFGPDGVRWTSFDPLIVMLKDRLEVGVSAINSSTKPLTAELEGVEVSHSPEAGADPKTGGLNSDRL